MIMIDVKLFRVDAGMGKSNYWKGLGLNKKQCEDINEIGYSGELNGCKISRLDITQVKYDNGNFHEEFIVAKAEQL